MSFTLMCAGYFLFPLNILEFSPGMQLLLKSRWSFWGLLKALISLEFILYLNTEIISSEYFTWCSMNHMVLPLWLERTRLLSALYELQEFFAHSFLTVLFPASDSFLTCMHWVVLSQKLQANPLKVSGAFFLNHSALYRQLSLLCYSVLQIGFLEFSAPPLNSGTVMLCLGSLSLHCSLDKLYAISWDNLRAHHVCFALSVTRCPNNIVSCVFLCVLDI